MIVQFFDRQNELNPENGFVVEKDTQLLEVFERLAARAPFFCELVGENGFNLLVGIGGGYGCAQYSRQDGHTPYLMATTETAQNRNEHIEFSMGNTLTPVPARYCLPFEVIKAIAVHFRETGKPYSSVDWEEI